MKYKTKWFGRDRVAVRAARKGAMDRMFKIARARALFVPQVFLRDADGRGWNVRVPPVGTEIWFVPTGLVPHRIG